MVEAMKAHVVMPRMNAMAVSLPLLLECLTGIESFADDSILSPMHIFRSWIVEVNLGVQM